MNKLLRHVFHALCAVLFVTVLAACGSSKTVDPLTPSRVIGLGDTLNDISTAAGGGTAHTARIAGAGADASVVGHLATLFGVSNVVSYASSTNQLISDLSAQIDNLGGLSASADLVVITVGTQDIILGHSGTSVAPTLVSQIQRLLDKGARHVLVMPPLDLSKAPTPPANAANAATFAADLSSALQNAFSGRYANNVVIYGNNPLSLNFALATASRTYPYSDGYGTFNDTYQSICGAGTTGCDRADDGGYLFADNYNLTPTGNRWVAQNLFAATGSGWR
jgi:hypothetical protein